MRQVAIILVALLLGLALSQVVRAGDGTIDGTASWYGPGNGVATHWCTWIYRHEHGCGFLAVQSSQTGIVIFAPVIDYCEICRWTPGSRVVDLQWGVVDALGLDRAQGVYPVTVWRTTADWMPLLPNTSTR
jgi:hypothetical protein